MLELIPCPNFSLAEIEMDPVPVGKPLILFWCHSGPPVMLLHPRTLWPRS